MLSAKGQVIMLAQHDLCLCLLIQLDKYAVNDGILGLNSPSTQGTRQTCEMKHEAYKGSQSEQNLLNAVILCLSCITSILISTSALAINSLLIATKVNELDAKQSVSVSKTSFTQQQPAKLVRNADKRADLKRLHGINQIAGLIKSGLNKAFFSKCCSGMAIIFDQPSLEDK